MADRLVIMDGGRIAMEGEPRSVFTQTDRILELGLDVPEMMKLAQMLREKGVELSEGIMTVNEMAVELCRLK